MGYPNIFVGTVEAYPDMDTLLRLVDQTHPEQIYLAPFMIVAGDPAFVSGLNSVGLARAGMAQEIRSQLKKLSDLYRSGLPLQEAVATMEQELDSSEPVEHLMRFLRNVERGIIRTRRD